MRPYWFRTRSHDGMSLIYSLPCAFDERSLCATLRFRRYPTLNGCALASMLGVVPASLHRQALSTSVTPGGPIRLRHTQGFESTRNEWTRSINPRHVVLEAITWRESALRLARNRVTNVLGAHNMTPHARVAGPSIVVPPLQ